MEPMEPRDDRWKVEVAFIFVAIIAIGGLGFAYLQSLFFYLEKSPLFLVVTVVLTLVAPVLSGLFGYMIGRHRKGNESERDKERDHQRHMLNMQVLSAMSGRRPDVVEVTPRSPGRNYIVPYIDNGVRINPPVDYRTMAHEWLSLGYPVFTREFLQHSGAGIGDNANYTILTNYLIKNGMVQRSTGRLPTDDPAQPDHTLYRWADAQGRTYGRREVGTWIDTHDWSDIG